MIFSPAAMWKSLLTCKKVSQATVNGKFFSGVNPG
jgi:hypothetical protein